jgi:REP-associated tyrosine transposase
MPGDRYRRGAHTVLELKYHFVWKTKYAYRVLRGEVGLRLRALIRQVCEEQQMTVLQGNIRADHVHLLVSAPSWLSPAKMAQLLKGKSSYRLQREFPHLRKKYWGQHLWSRGYFCATVGAVTEEQIKAYIAHQDEDASPLEVWDEVKEDELPGSSSDNDERA